MPNAARLVAKMDKGQGLVDRFLISLPYARCAKSSEIQESIEYLATECFDDFEVVYRMIVEFHKYNAINYKFDDDADQVLKNKRDDLSGDINDAINDGETPPPK